MKKSSHKDPLAAKDAVLRLALSDVPFDGWTTAVLQKALEKTGQDARLFPRGVADLVAHFSGWADRAMLRAMDGHDMAQMRVRDRVALGVRCRLEVLTPHKQAVSMAGLRARGRHVWATADVIWRRAGDTATDYNHYTKRLLLSGVLAATTLYWLADDSEGHDATWAFLDRRIADVMTLGGMLARRRAAA